MEPESQQGRGRMRTPMAASKVRAIQAELLDLQVAAAQHEARLSAKAESFVLRHHDSGAFSTDESVETQTWRVQRTISGIAKSLRRSMPVEVRRAGEGILVVTTKASDESPDIVAHWEKNLSTKYYLPAISDRCAILFGEFEEERARRELTGLILNEIHDGTLPLPEFTLISSQGGVSQWKWKRATLETN